MISPADLDLIERYLLGKMSDADIRSFEARLADDRELTRKLRLIKTFPEMMSEAGKAEYDKKLTEATMKVVKRTPLLSLKHRYLAGAAVSSLIIIVFTILLISRGPGHHNEKVVSQDTLTSISNIVKTAAEPVKDTIAVSSQQEKKIVQKAADSKSNKVIELLNPAEGMKFSRKEVILFNWTQKTDTFTRFYIVSDLHNQVVYWRGVRPGVREFKVPGSYFFPGKYYWYVGTKEARRTFIIGE